MPKVTYYSVRSPSRRRMKNLGLALIVIVILLFVFTLYIRHIYLTNLRPVSSSQQNRLITIKSGDSLPQITSTLKAAGVIRSNWSFEWYVKNDSFARDNLQAGTYNFQPDETVQTIVAQLTDGQIPTNLVTILPDQRIDQIQQGLVRAGFKKADVTAALDS